MNPDSKNQKRRLQDALSSAIALFEQTFDHHFPANPELRVMASEEFFASIRKTNEKFIMEFSTGVVDAVDALWSDLWETTVLTSGERFERIQCGEGAESTANDYANLCLGEGNVQGCMGTTHGTG